MKMNEALYYLFLHHTSMTHFKMYKISELLERYTHKNDVMHNSSFACGCETLSLCPKTTTVLGTSFTFHTLKCSFPALILPCSLAAG